MLHLSRESLSPRKLRLEPPRVLWRGLPWEDCEDNYLLPLASEGGRGSLSDRMPASDVLTASLQQIDEFCRGDLIGSWSKKVAMALCGVKSVFFAIE